MAVIIAVEVAAVEETITKAKEQRMQINMFKTVHKINHSEGGTIIIGVAVEEEEEVSKEAVAIIIEVEAVDIAKNLIFNYTIMF